MCAWLPSTQAVPPWPRVEVGAKWAANPCVRHTGDLHSTLCELDLKVAPAVGPGSGPKLLSLPCQSGGTRGLLALHGLSSAGAHGPWGWDPCDLGQAPALLSLSVLSVEPGPPHHTL